MEKILSLFEKFKKDGKIRAIGASIKGCDVTQNTVDLSNQYIKSNKIDVLQVIYSIFRQKNSEVFKIAKDNKVGIVARTILENGFLAEYQPSQTLKLPLSLSSSNRNSALCISDSPHFGAGLCYSINPKSDRWGNARGSYGDAGFGTPTCNFCKSAWNDLSLIEKNAWEQGFKDWNDDYNDIYYADFQYEYQPSQTLTDYSPEQLMESSAIEGYKPLKYSVMRQLAETYAAESDEKKEEARLKKYTKTYGEKGAKIRNRIFKRILKNKQDGTKAGQWSARKAQSLTEDYEKAMKKKGIKAYKSGKKTKSQKSLKRWGDQDWKTKSGKKSSKTGERYLPAEAIKALTDKEYKKTSAKKKRDTKKGKQFSDQPKDVAKKVKKYRAESMKPYSVEISRSSNDEKKLMAVFYDKENDKIKTTHFGQRGASDYTKHGEKERMERYLERHGGGTTTSTKEDWKDPVTAGSLSRWILWNKPDLKASFNDYKRRFNLEGELKVKRS